MQRPTRSAITTANRTSAWILSIAPFPKRRREFFDRLPDRAPQRGNRVLHTAHCKLCIVCKRNQTALALILVHWPAGGVPRMRCTTRASRDGPARRIWELRSALCASARTQIARSDQRVAAFAALLKGPHRLNGAAAGPSLKVFPRLSAEGTESLRNSGAQCVEWFRDRSTLLCQRVRSHTLPVVGICVRIIIVNQYNWMAVGRCSPPLSALVSG